MAKNVRSATRATPRSRRAPSAGRGPAVPRSPRGRLQLTWTNKDLRLLSPDDGRYEWVEQHDPRVAEVRLLHDVKTVGETRSRRAGDNLLIQGDALNAMTSLFKLPEFAREYAGKVKLCYIDPPFNTGIAFAHYDDGLEHSVWLTMIRDRLAQIRDLLAPDGSVWLHLDDTEVHRARCVLDEEFGSDNYVATVIWEKTDSPRMDADGFSTRHDTILVYRKSSRCTIHPLPTDKSHANRVDADGYGYYLNPLRARGGQGSTRAARPTLFYPVRAPDGSEVYPQLPDGGDGAWRWSRDRVVRDSHLIEWIDGRRGWNPYYRIYDQESPTRPPETLWTFAEVGSTRTSAKEIKDLLDGKAFSTPKPERLLERIMQIATEPGDIVLDCFAGSATTAAVAQKLGRRWVAIEREVDTVAEFCLPRLAKVISGEDEGGISQQVTELPVGSLPDGMDPADARKAATVLTDLFEFGAFDDVEGASRKLVRELATRMRAAGKIKRQTVEMWSGGGGFRVLEVAPSMFEDVDGSVCLADWATNGALAQATAAQFGYDFIDASPFCGHKGKTQLAVIDGLANVAIVRELVDRLEPDERLALYATVIDAEARPLLKELRPGSTLAKIPNAILEQYQGKSSRYRRTRRVRQRSGSR